MSRYLLGRRIFDVRGEIWTDAERAQLYQRVDSTSFSTEVPMGRRSNLGKGFCFTLGPEELGGLPFNWQNI